MRINGSIIGSVVTSSALSATGVWGLQNVELANRLNIWPGFHVTSGLILNLDTSNVSSYPGSGTVWYDLSGNNNGTLTNGPTFSSANGGSIVFDGTNDYVSVAYNATLNTPTGATYEIWFKPTIGTTGAFLTRGTSDSGATPDNPRFIVYNTGKLYFDWSSPGADVYLETATGVVTLGIWNQVLGIATPSTQLRTFVNGVETTYATRVNTLPSTLPNTSTPLEIGATTWAPSYFNGNIAIVRLYNRTLTANEIQQNFNAARARFGV